MYDRKHYKMSYFQKIEEGHVVPTYNHVYVSFVYHSYEVLQIIAELHPTYLQKTISELFFPADRQFPLTSHPIRLIKDSGKRSTFSRLSLVSLELLRNRPSFRFIQFFIAHGYQVVYADRKILKYKRHPRKYNDDKRINGFAMGTPEDNVDLPKIHSLFKSKLGL